MADFVKIAAKIALIAVVMGAGIAILGGIVIPTINVEPLAVAVGKGKAILDYYLTGGFGILFIVGMALIVLKYVLMPGLKAASIVWRWVFKVNE